LPESGSAEEYSDKIYSIDSFLFTNSGTTGTTTSYIESQNKLITNLKNKLTMNLDEIFEDDDLDLSDKAQLEKIRLKLAHDIAMKKLEREDEELSLRKRELRIKEEVAFSDRRKIEKQGKTLIFRFRKLAEKAEEGEWTYGNIDVMSAKATDLKEEIEKYCFENDIETENLSILVILEKIESEFENLQDDDSDDDDTINVEFDEDVLEMVERANDVDFEDYEE